MILDFSRCRDVWVPDEEREAVGFWSKTPEHVKVGVRFILGHPYALLADDMGGMKSAQTVIAAQFLHDADLIDRVIVVAPAAVRPKVWFDEQIGQIAEQAFDDKRVLVSEYHQKVRHWSRGPKDAKELRIICTNYEWIRGANLAELLKYCGPKTFLVLDESSAVRGDSAQTDACMKMRWLTNARGRPVFGAARCGRILELNGTPVAESPQDMFTQGNLLHPSILDCRYITHFKARYAVLEPVMERGKPMRRYGRVVTSIAGWSKRGIEDIQRRFAPYVLRREAKDFGVDFALPPIALEVRLTPATWKHYTSMRDSMVAWLESGVATAHQAGVKSIRLSQITSGFVGGVEELGFDPEGGDECLFDLDDGGALRASSVTSTSSSKLTIGSVTTMNPTIGNINVASAAAPSMSQYGNVVEVGREKLDFAISWYADLLERYPDLKLLTWCRFVPELSRYLHEVRLTFPGVPVGAACGSKIFSGEHNKDAERNYALGLLHPKTAPKGPAIVGATQGTGAMGLNFTACRTVLDMSYDFSPWKKKQGDARVNRTGQRGLVSFFYLVAVGPKGQKTIDHHVLLQRMGKADVADWTTKAWVRALTEE